jgi:DNA polymerase-3 subunit alpha
VFVHLRCHSHYSFLRAVASPEEIIAAAVALGMPAVALTDTNGLYGAVKFYQAAKAAEVKGIVGVTLDVEWRVASDEWREKNGEIPRFARNDGSEKSVPMALLAADMEGYSNLCQLVTLRQLGTTELAQNIASAETDERPVTMQELAEHSRGVIALCPLPARFHETEKNQDHDEATKWIAQLKTIFCNRLYIEVEHLSAGDGRWVREAERIGRELGVPLVATNNVHFLKPEEHLHHRAVNAIRTGGVLTTVAPPEITTGEAWFKPAVEMQKLFPDHPEWLRATVEIAERCNLELGLGKLILPEFEVPEHETPDSYLAKQSLLGLNKRYGSRKPEAVLRLAHELRIIKKWGLAPYFLLVWSIVEEAKRRGIPAVARGSAASSMVTYCLGISCVCPLRWGLYFERFLNEERGDCPDIDIDICGARRDELLDYVYERWGSEHVAMIGSFVTMHARMAVREVAKVFGVPPEEVNSFSKRLPHTSVAKILRAIHDLPECRELPVEEEPWKTILQVALRLDDAPRHTGIHPCGTVISARPLAQLVPLERATKGIVVTQYEMGAIEALGLIKMDLLGQRGFTTMSLALDNIERAAGASSTRSEIAPDGTTPRPKARNLDFDAIPENDPETCDVIAAGRTLGVFQIESPAMRGLLSAMKARTLEEIAMALALIRPGAAEFGSKELFLKRLRGEEKVTYAHKLLEPILESTWGVCIFQEQVMQIAQTAASMSLAEADLIRRASSTFSGRQDRERLQGKFLESAGLMGLSKTQREEAWKMVEKFAGFGFCKAHSATYADISYRMAYLKTHHTVEFLAAMCSAGAGFYHVSAYVEEAKRWGIEVRLPCVNQSLIEYSAERAQGGKPALRIGLMQIRGLRIETLLTILHAREEKGPFSSLEDFLRRVPVECDEIEALIKCGAFDEVMPASRAEMLWRWNLLQNGTERVTNKNVFTLPETTVLFAEEQAEDSIGVALAEMEMPDYTIEQKLHHERKILEVCVSGHPLDFLPRHDEVWSDELPKLRGKRVTLCGWLVTYRRVGTKTYRNMMFVTLEDQRGVYEAVLFPEAYERYGRVVFETRAMRVTGRVEVDGQINCEKLEALRK